MLNEAITKLENREYEEAKVMLEKCVQQTPEDPQVNFYLASANDSMGLETNAIPHYRRAIENGIQGEKLEAAFIQLGSSYRCLGEYQYAKDVLSAGLEQFPENPALKLFYAMTLYNLGEHKESVTLLLNTLITSADNEWLKRYEKALKFYSEDIDGVWN
ncbi:tetratricopeptide repeat protein [Rossellomorea vietnamensis]|uniref:Tetratricopeptide repeat protein n=1 Tax=Rossellomorea vietnamensis TaxID=218284 RepID=A0A5D4NZ67_9BACI|nr:tetratricopeptide repeat protein [Rossellomorea vietnamensis]TYS19605.1 tetratricopeptide repeat protein [Rossellomorea vietnamensis]